MNHLSFLPVPRFIHLALFGLFVTITAGNLTACGQKGELYLSDTSSLPKNDKFLLKHYKQNKQSTKKAKSKEQTEIDKQIQQNTEKMQSDPNDY